MQRHGRGPEFICVRRYLRWVNGKLYEVTSHRRGFTFPEILRDSELQLDFGF